MILIIMNLILRGSEAEYVGCRQPDPIVSFSLRSRLDA